MTKLMYCAGDVRIAGAVAAPIIMPFFLFGGLYQNDRSVLFVLFNPVWVKLIANLNIQSYH